MSKIWSWRQAIFESQLSATTKLVLSALGSHLNDMGDAMFPSQDRLARLCSLSERSVITHLEIAEQEGWIQSKRKEIEGRKWASKCYYATWPQEVKEVHPSSSRGVKEVHVRGERDSGRGVKEVHTNSPIELSNELSTPLTPQGGEESEFQLFWKAYPNAPHKGGAENAKGVWDKLVPPLPEVLNALKHLEASENWQKEGRRFVPSATKWLSNRAWEGFSSPEQEAQERAAAAERVRTAELAHADLMEKLKAQRFEKLTGKKYDAA